MELKGKNVAIFGLGVSGLAALSYCHHLEANITVLNRGEVKDWGSLVAEFDDIDLMSESDSMAQEVLGSQDLILLSPGIPRTHPVLQVAFSKEVPVWNEVELGFRHFQGEVIAVTGTNGKTSTVTMIGEVLKNAGVDVFVGGNIGVPFVEALRLEKPPKVAVLELSSFQLEGLDSFKPKMAAILNISPGHGERYESPLDYAKAKSRIALKMDQEDQLFLGPCSPECIIEEELDSFSGNFQKHLLVKDSLLESELKEHISLKEWKLPGVHNLRNLWFTDHLTRPFLKDSKALQKLVDNFKGVSHRLEYIENKASNVLFYNDAKSTNWESTLSALSSLKAQQRPLYLICGGKKRGRRDLLDKKSLLLVKDSVKEVFTIGESGPLVAEQLGEKASLFKGLSELWDKRIQSLSEGIVLFSPGFPSFDQYENYQKRGEEFILLVRTLSEKAH